MRLGRGEAGKLEGAPGWLLEFPAWPCQVSSCARREDLLVVLATGLFAAGLCFVPPTVSESGDFVLYSKPTFHFLAESVRA